LKRVGARIIFAVHEIMSVASAGVIAIASNVLLDGRLALFHETERWLAVADLHFGYELSQRAAGNLVPLWGMKSIEQRLKELLDDYRPQRLIIVGDLVHDRASLQATTAFLARLRGHCEIIVLSGNHDRHLQPNMEFSLRWETPDFVFHHGHCVSQVSERIQIIGHYHPAAAVRDGAGLRLKCPAFIQQGNCWILPAFSPWAAGVEWPDDGRTRIWLCTPRRILRVDANGSAA
jgi:DNA ligase-associated metallophosphoesterase